MVPCCIWVIVGPFTEVSGSRNFPAPTEHPVHLPGGAQDDDSIPQAIRRFVAILNAPPPPRSLISLSGFGIASARPRPSRSSQPGVE